MKMRNIAAWMKSTRAIVSTLLKHKSIKRPRHCTGSVQLICGSETETNIPESHVVMLQVELCQARHLFISRAPPTGSECMLSITQSQPEGNPWEVGNVYKRFWVCVIAL